MKACSLRQFPHCFRLLLGTLLAALAITAYAPAQQHPGAAAGTSGSQPENRLGRVLVVANQESPASLEIARAYMRARKLSEKNLLLVSVDDPVEISADEFTESIMQPVAERLEKIGRAVDYIVITRGIPYRTGDKSTTAALMFGGHDNIQENQGFYEQEREFDSTIPVMGVPLRPSTALITYNVDDALRLIERSLVQYDSPDEPGRFYFCEGVGPRGIRNDYIRGAVNLVEAQGGTATRVSNHDIRNRDDVMMQFTGKQRVHVSSNIYHPGSILDNVTSFGGYLLEQTNQTSVTTFIQYGVCGTHGAVVEPTNIPTRWPHLSLGARYLAGFNLIDSYLQTIRDMSLSVIVGDPLMAPYAKPPRVELDWRPETEADSQSAGVIQVQSTEAIDNQGIAWLELWSNDDTLKGTVTPRLPAGSTVSCIIQVGREQVFDAEYTMPSALPLHRALRQIALQARNKEHVDLLPAGRYGNKLLARLGPAILADVNAQAQIYLTISSQGREYPRALSFSTHPVPGRAGIIDLSGGHASRGEALRITVEGEMITLRAPSRAPARAMARLLKEELNNQHPSFGDDGEWRAVIGREPQQVWILHRDRTSGERTDVTVYRQRNPGSEFAGNLQDGRIPWQRVPAAAIGETVIAPYLPTAEMNFQISLTRQEVAQGANRFYAMAGTPGGAEVKKRLDFSVTQREDKEPSFSLEGETFDLGDQLSLALQPPEGDNSLRPVLVLNNQPVTIGQQADQELTAELELPRASPGTNKVWVEWRQNETMSAGSSPLYRSQPRQFHIRRPLASEAELAEKELAAGKENTLQILGPYLSEGVKAEVAGHTLELERSERFGLRWSAELPPLGVGEYEITLIGDEESEKSGVLTDVLHIREDQED